MTCSEGESEVMTSVPRAFSRMCSMSSLTTLKLTSASSRAMRISLSASPMFSSVRVPCPRRFLKARWSLSVRFSNMIGVQIDGYGGAVFAREISGYHAKCRRFGYRISSRESREHDSGDWRPATGYSLVTLVSCSPRNLLRLPPRPLTTKSVTLGEMCLWLARGYAAYLNGSLTIRDLERKCADLR